MANLNRRTFLELTGVGVGALALAGKEMRAGVRAAARSTPQSINTTTPEIAVIGAGAFGGWTALHLRELGLSVELVDAYGPGNARASSAGETRQIRASYGDREIYSRWVVKAFEQWTRREEEFGKKLFFRTGQLTLSRGLTRNLRQSKAVLDRLGLENEIIDRDELLRRFTQFNLEGVELGFYVPSTGIVKCRESCLAVAEALKNKGGQLTLAKADPGRKAGGRLQEVTLSTGRTIAAQSLVFACGPWHTKMFPEILGDKLRLNRRVLFFMGTPPDDNRLTFPNCPTFETTSGVYGFPDFEGKGLKLAPYWDSGPLDPDTDERTATAEEITNIHQLTESVFPALRGQPLLETRVSPRTNSIDGHFIVDRHPELENVWLVGGGSGHAFKHGPVLGDYIANRVAGQETDPELDATFKLKDERF